MRGVLLAEALADAEVFTDGDWVESKDQDPDGDVRLIQLADVGVGDYLNKSSRFMTSGKASELRCTYLRTGDLLVARMPEPLGRACLFPGDSKASVTVVDVCVIRADQATIDHRWLMHWFNSPDARQAMERSSTGTTRKRISRGNLAKLGIHLPPIEEQRRIAAILDAADALRAKRRQALAKLDTLTQAIFIDMFGDLAAADPGWPMLSLGELLTAGPQNGLYKPSSQYGEGVKILRIDGFNAGVVSGYRDMKRVSVTPEELAKYRLNESDIVINRVNSRSHLGKSAFIPCWDEPVIFESNMMRCSVDEDRIRPRFAIQVLKSDFVKRQILSACKDAINQSSINQGDVKGFVVPVPPIEQQHEFVAGSAAVEAEQATQTLSSAQLDTLFASLQQRAFRGEL